ncbi:hypothetical protein [Subtercola sp. YIM 133946]|uniref:hypothetical protein n=1 Tax=Subtercola sp. YIM 133946 TaxID=3118909 RepID=UPI002F94984D
MKGKLLVIAGFGAGYLAGSAAGRKRYEQIKAKASAVVNDPKVQKTVKDAGAFIAEKAPEVVGSVQNAVADVAKKAPDKVKDAASKVREGAEDGYKKATS